MNDEIYMKRAIELAKKGTGFVNPNPLVGAVIVKDGEIIGEGYHEKFGELHAERNALKNCIKSPEGATIYVTLEPCCHHGKTPPCTEAIIESGIKRVVVGALDVNPLVAGNGVRILRDHGIEVVTGILADECTAMNKVFNKYIQKKRPYVVMKYAMTADGKIATDTGKSKWITCEESRKEVHVLRNRLMGIMVGVSTIIADNPMLNCRLDMPHRDPIRIICDTNLRTPLDSKVVRTADTTKTIIATASEDKEKLSEYEKKGCKIVNVPMNSEGIDLNILMKKLGELGIDGILLEGGGTLNNSALRAHIVDEVHTFMAPKIFGGMGKSPVTGIFIDEPDEAIELNVTEISRVGEDLLIESEVKYKCLPE
ncbi:MAG: bifunctional diaminohydroxyphosphoribosylaminopyrimidine deaminase/5-amino-6-(5-phosphoribosylamino)uracil reductase RibD [Butyrivibrio sp.]|nr:bifunctional diaminohydroxyphosphoribosylaminopyrimidine deaminase/5-amino-6-(5-phosphoribosylamino)uracil reductase RibD [Butyrivibrio sp.]